MKVKICGITTLDDALMVAEAGADLIGLNFYAKSPRYIKPDAAQRLCDALRTRLGEDCPTLVGVFVNATVGDISIITNKVGLDFAQLSGDETQNMFAELRGIGFKSIQPMNKAMALEDVKYFNQHFLEDERIPSILLDAYHATLRGGTGESASTDVALAVKEAVPRMMLAGGLKPDNVRGRVQTIQPWGVDVASGVEDGTPGIKSESRVRAFIEAAKNA